MSHIVLLGDSIFDNASYVADNPDVITRQAFKAGVPLIDLRLTCNEARDYANPIEPSAEGSEKIVNAIMNVVLEHDFSKSYTQVFY